MKPLSAKTARPVAQVEPLESILIARYSIDSQGLLRSIPVQILVSLAHFRLTVDGKCLLKKVRILAAKHVRNSARTIHTLITIKNSKCIFLILFQDYLLKKLPQRFSHQHQWLARLHSCLWRSPVQYGPWTSRDDLVGLDSCNACRWWHSRAICCWPSLCQ